eukprot:1157935-Pelagomonas_calceolata.AAC.11
MSLPVRDAFSNPCFSNSRVYGQGIKRMAQHSPPIGCTPGAEAGRFLAGQLRNADIMMQT